MVSAPTPLEDHGGAATAWVSQFLMCTKLRGTGKTPWSFWTEQLGLKAVLYSQHPQRWKQLNPRELRPTKGGKQKVERNARKTTLCCNHNVTCPDSAGGWQPQVCTRCFPRSHCRSQGLTQCCPVPRCGDPQHSLGLLLQPFDLALAAGWGN